jgi:hypothetical protein
MNSKRSLSGGSPRKSRRRSKISIPRTAEQYFSLPEEEQATWDAVAHVISLMRADRISLPRAAKEFGVDPEEVRKRGRGALRKQKNGRYFATKTDRLLRVVSILTGKGKKEIATRDSRQASLIGSYWAAVQRHLQTGDDSALLKFKKIRIVDASGKRHRLLTDLKELVRQASAGVLSFESMYAGGSR